MSGNPEKGDHAGCLNQIVIEEDGLRVIRDSAGWMLELVTEKPRGWQLVVEDVPEFRGQRIGIRRHEDVE